MDGEVVAIGAGIAIVISSSRIIIRNLSLNVKAQSGFPPIIQ